MWHRHPEWVRSCRDCEKWVMKADGSFVTYQVNGVETRIPQPSPPCWSCPKQPEDGTPPEKRKPLHGGQDFGPWFEDLREWWQECRAVGFPPDLGSLMRSVAKEFDLAERAEDKRRHNELIQLMLRRRQ